MVKARSMGQDSLNLKYSNMIHRDYYVSCYGKIPESALNPFILRYKSANIQIATDQQSEVKRLRDKFYQLTNSFQAIGELNNG